MGRLNGLNHFPTPTACQNEKPFWTYDSESHTGGSVAAEAARASPTAMMTSPSPAQRLGTAFKITDDQYFADTTRVAPHFRIMVVIGKRIDMNQWHWRVSSAAAKYGSVACLGHLLGLVCMCRVTRFEIGGLLTASKALASQQSRSPHGWHGYRLHFWMAGATRPERPAR